MGLGFVLTHVVGVSHCQLLETGLLLLQVKTALYAIGLSPQQALSTRDVACAAVSLPRDVSDKELKAMQDFVRSPHGKAQAKEAQA